jgi:hypothetical protein
MSDNYEDYLFQLLCGLFSVLTLLFDHNHDVMSDYGSNSFIDVRSGLYPQHQASLRLSMLLTLPTCRRGAPS